MDIKERFDAVEDEYLDFDSVTNKFSDRPDLHAFILLDKCFPGSDRNMIQVAEHDEFWLDVEAEKLGELSDEQILDLTRCGVRYDSDNNCLAMFT